MVAPYPIQPSPELVDLVHERAGSPGDPETLEQAERMLLDLRGAADHLLVELRHYMARTDRILAKTRAELGDPPAEPKPPAPIRNRAPRRRPIRRASAPVRNRPLPRRKPGRAAPESPALSSTGPDLCACGCARRVEQSGNGGRKRIWWSDACRKRGRTAPPGALSTGVIHTPPQSTDEPMAA